MINPDDCDAIALRQGDVAMLLADEEHQRLTRWAIRLFAFCQVLFADPDGMTIAEVIDDLNMAAIQFPRMVVRQTNGEFTEE